LANSHRSILPGDVPLLAGGICGLTTAIILGPVYGALAAAMAALPAWLIWHKPYLLVAFTLEATAVAILSRRRWKPLLADAAYWALIGVPGLIAWLHWDPAGAILPFWLLVTNVPSNGIINVLVAEILAATSAVRRWSGDSPGVHEPRRLRAQLAHAFLLVGIVPAFILNMAGDRIYGNKYEKAERARLDETAAAIQQNVDDYVSRHKTALASLSRAIEMSGKFDTAALNQWVAAWHQAYPGFQTLTLSDRAGTSIAQDPIFVAPPNSPVLLIKDRAYFQATIVSRLPQASDVIWGRVAKQPIVTLTAPVFARNGELAGVLIGSLKLNEFVNFGKSYPSLRNVAIVVADGSDQVIYSSHPAQYRAMQSLRGNPLLASATRKQTTAPDGDGSRLNLVSYALCGSVPWKIFLEEPLAALHIESDQYYRLTLACLLAAVAASLLLVRSLGASVTNPLENLVNRVRAFKIGAPQEPVEPAAFTAAPTEVAQLLGDFENMAARLNQSYVELQDALAGRERANDQLHELLKNLDAKVQERTAQLSEAKVSGRGQSREESVPGEYEPRDPHADERGSRFDGAGAELRPEPRAAPAPSTGPLLSRSFAHAAERYSRFLENRGGPAGDGVDSIFAARVRDRGGEDARFSGAPKRIGAEPGDRGGRAGAVDRRSSPSTPGAAESDEQRNQVHRPWLRANLGDGSRSAEWRNHSLLRRPRQRNRDPGERAAADPGALPSGRPIRHSQIWRHRAGASHLFEHRRNVGRKTLD
jgi:hypothetical protein